MARDPRHLLAGYATGSLDQAERGELLRAALDDQELFDALVEEEGLRELLHDAAARQEVLAVLEEPTDWERVRAWFERPATLLDLATVGLVAAAAIVGLGLVALRPASHSLAARPTGTSLSAARVQRLLELPEKQVVPAGVEIDGRAAAAFAPSELIPLRISLRAPARVVVLSEPASGPSTQAWPALGQPPALVPPREGGGPAILAASIEASQAAGSQRLRLVVAPAELDLGSLSPGEFEAAAGRLTIVDLRYQVKQR